MKARGKYTDALLAKYAAEFITGATDAVNVTTVGDVAFPAHIRDDGVWYGPGYDTASFRAAQHIRAGDVVALHPITNHVWPAKTGEHSIGVATSNAGVGSPVTVKFGGSAKTVSFGKSYGVDVWDKDECYVFHPRTVTTRVDAPLPSKPVADALFTPLDITAAIVKDAKPSWEYGGVRSAR